MSFVKNNIWQLISFVLLIIIFIQNSCNKPKRDNIEITPIPPIVISNVTTYKPEPKVIILETTKIKWKTDWIIKWEKEKMDSVKIKELYKKYYGISVYDETVVNDSSVKVRVVDSISENKIMSRHVEYEVFPIMYEKKIKEPPRIKMYGGLALGGGINQFGFSPKLFMTDKKNHIYTVSYNIITGYTEIGVGWLITFRRKK